MAPVVPFSLPFPGPSPLTMPINVTPQMLAAANVYRQPAPPPQLPLLQLPGRHQVPLGAALLPDGPNNDADPSPLPQSRSSPLGPQPPSKPSSPQRQPQPGQTQPQPHCPYNHSWPARGTHSTERTARLSEAELSQFLDDMSIVVRREFDCWVELCWIEAFHYIFTHHIPTFIISLILNGATPALLRRRIVHGGPALDQEFMTHMLEELYRQLGRRMNGALPSDPNRGESSAMATAAAAIGAGGLGAQPSANASLPRDGVCTHDLASSHAPTDTPVEDDDHAACLCQLAACVECLHVAARMRKTPVSLLPHELTDEPVARGWAGAVETYEQHRERLYSSLVPSRKEAPPAGRNRLPIPAGKGFVKQPKRGERHDSDGTPPTPEATPPPNRPVSPPPITFPHPQMTDVLAVEEHLRWRLKELGASDPSVEARYGPSQNARAAMEGLEEILRLDEDDESETSSVAGGPNGTGCGAGAGGGGANTPRGRAGGRKRLNKTIKPPPKPRKAEPKARVYLPPGWTGEPQECNMAMVLTFRHYVKLLHRIAVTHSPFSYPSYPSDIHILEQIHPVALYRRLTESSATRKTRPARDARDARGWVDCVDKWTEELGAREKASGNLYVNVRDHASAIESYTRAISLDPKKTIYYTNRAVARNALGDHEGAEADCQHILNKDAKNSKAFYQRALARAGRQRWRDAEADLKCVLRLQPGNEAATALMGIVKVEVGKLPRQTLEDALNF